MSSDRQHLSKQWPLRAENKEPVGGEEVGRPRSAAVLRCSEWGNQVSERADLTQVTLGVQHSQDLLTPKSVLTASKEMFFLNKRQSRKEPGNFLSLPSVRLWPFLGAVLRRRGHWYVST